jgi:type I restriction enzyme, S subunit
VKRMRLGDAARFINGVAFKPSEWADDGFPIIRIQNLTGTGENFNRTNRVVRAELIVEPGDLLVSWSATLDAYRWSGPRGVLNQHIFKVLPKDGVRADYLYYALREVISELERKTHGSTMKHVVRGDFESTTIPMPSLSEQQRIVNLLTRAENIVRMRQEAERKAKEITPALFLDMFGDPATNPKGWETSSLGQVTSEFRYGSSQKSTVAGDPVLRIPNVIGGSINVRDLKLLSASEIDRMRYSLARGDILFVRTNGNPDYVGRCAVFEPPDDRNWLYASYLIRARLMPATVDPYFLQAQLSCVEGRRRLREHARTAAGQFNINVEGLRGVGLMLPPLAVQQAFTRIAADVRALSGSMMTAASSADEAFQSLLAGTFGESLQQ